MKLTISRDTHRYVPPALPCRGFSFHPTRGLGSMGVWRKGRMAVLLWSYSIISFIRHLTTTLFLNVAFDITHSLCSQRINNKCLNILKVFIYEHYCVLAEVAQG